MKGQEKEQRQKEINTPDWLRSFPGCEHYGDEEALEIIHSLNVYATILLENVAHKLEVNKHNVTDLTQKKYSRAA